MKMKKLCAFVAAGMLALSLVACTDGNEPAKTATEKEALKIQIQRVVK